MRKHTCAILRPACTPAIAAHTARKRPSLPRCRCRAGVAVRPVPSLLREFSAPVRMAVEGQSDDDLKLMFASDSDPFNR